jgi:DNA polymerase III epsilon subunit-like protein
MRHCNGHQICVIDTETTGIDPTWNEMIQLAILPLDANLNPRKDVIPFNIYLKPEHPERANKDAMKVNKLKMSQLILNGYDRECAKGLLEEWIKKLELPVTSYGTPKKIIPLGHNVSFDINFITAWLTQPVYSQFFDYHIRDTACVAQFLNDHAAMHGERVPYSKVNLNWLCNQLNVDFPTKRQHDALQDCIVTAQVYKRLIQHGLLA